MYRRITSTLVAASFTLALLTTGCAERHYYRAQDPYYGDYHVFTPAENGYYVQWERERHYDHHEFRDRRRAEQQEYFKWRHDHDRDHDHDKH